MPLTPTLLLTRVFIFAEELATLKRAGQWFEYSQHKHANVEAGKKCHQAEKRHDGRSLLTHLMLYSNNKEGAGTTNSWLSCRDSNTFIKFLYILGLFTFSAWTFIVFHISTLIWLFILIWLLVHSNVYFFILRFFLLQRWYWRLCHLTRLFYLYHWKELA